MRDLQAALGTEVDAGFGRRAETALRAFQERAGLPVDGIAGPDTESAPREHRAGS